MRSVGIKELKDKLSEYIRIASAGETVRVTDRGRTVAEISKPADPASARSPEEAWAELVRKGIVKPAKNRTRTPPPRPRPVMTFEELMRDLDADRADR